ncbi:MAG: response regulator transcription factor [Chloroflexota bacterium]
MKTILIIEDETELVRVLKDYLKNAGFEVLTAYRGDTGLSTWEQKRPDLVILDLNLPGKDGLDVAREIRHKANTPIIMLTARIEEVDQLIGLELGADDYLTKPFSPRILIARVRALLRRSTATPPTPRLLRVEDIVINLDAHSVIRGEQTVDLTPTEFNLLVTLAQERGRTFTRLQLLETTQGHTYEGYERTIDAHIKNLRAKIELNPKNPRYIETVFGVGYRFSGKN